MSGPLEGLTVVECSQWIAGSAVGTILGDLGAEVIKVENPAGGDPGRAMIRMSQIRSDRHDHVGRNFFFEYSNRSKRSVAIDLRQQEGQEVIHKLIEKTDIFVHNLRYDAAERLGLNYQLLARHNPRLIYATVSGWGPQGPDRLSPAFEPLVWARMGWLYFAGEEGAPPSWFVSGPGDQTAATTTVVAILSALWARERTGVGQEIDTSILSANIYLNACTYTAKLLLGYEFPRRARDKVANPLCTFFQCGDGGWIFLYMLQSDRYWHSFCQVMGIAHLEKDPRFMDMDTRHGHSEELVHVLDDIFATKPLDEWLKLLRAGEDLVFAPVRTVSEAITDPQVLANEYITDFDHPVFGPIKTVGLPYKFSKTSPAIRMGAPELGQHTEEVLLELGYTWEKIAGLKDKGVLG